MIICIGRHAKFDLGWQNQVTQKINHSLSIIYKKCIGVKKLITKCNFCSSEMKIKSYAPTRPDLEMHRGEKFKVSCNQCLRPQEKQANDVIAIASNFILIGGVVIGIVVTVLLWKMLGAIGTVSIIIPILIYNSELNAVALFNSYRV